MPKLDRYLFREFAQSTFAALVVLMIVSLGGVFARELAKQMPDAEKRRRADFIRCRHHESRLG